MYDNICNVTFFREKTSTSVAIMSQSLWKGILFSASLFLSCFFGTLVLLTPLIPVALMWPSVGRRFMDLALWLWFVFAAVSPIFSR